MDVNVWYRGRVIGGIRDVRAGENGKRCRGGIDDIQVRDPRVKASYEAFSVVLRWVIAMGRRLRSRNS